LNLNIIRILAKKIPRIAARDVTRIMKDTKSPAI